GFVVAWHSKNQDGNAIGVFGRLYDNQGQAVGDEFQVNTYTTADQSVPAVAMNELGNAVIIWQSVGQDGDGAGVYGQLYLVGITGLSGSNNTPVGVPDEYLTSPNTALEIATNLGVLSNDTDADQDSLTAVWVSDPRHGALT